MAGNSRIVVIGAGSWGTALAIHLSRCDHQVSLWARSADHVRNLQEERCNTRYLPDITFPTPLMVTSQLEESVRLADAIVIATPSSGFSQMLTQLKPLLAERTSIIWACKGFSEGRLLSEVVYSQLGDLYPAAVLSGPNFARELALGLPTATTVASSSLAVSQRTCAWFHFDIFRAYASDDIIGVQLAGALKNIYAIASGVSDGLGFGANARAALITRGIAEMSRLAEHLGARPETLLGLSGVGDLVLTCTDDQSRNRRFGLAMGRGAPASEASAGIGQVVEGVSATNQALNLARSHQVEMPIATQVALVIEGKESPRAAVENLLSRAPRNE